MTPAKDSSMERSWPALAAIFALALGLRLWGAAFGLPFIYHPDEGALVMPALNILKTGDYRPLRLDYGSAYIYSLTAVYIPYFLYGAWRGLFTSVADLPVYIDYHQIGAYPFPVVFLLGRLLTAVLGSLTVLVVYAVGNRLAGRWAGLAAAAFLAVMPIHASNSHFVATDVPATLALLVALTHILNVLDRGHWRDYLWSGFWVGLAASTKYLTGIALSAFLVAHGLRARNYSEFFVQPLAVGMAAVAGGFLLGTPYALDLPYFLNWLASLMRFYGELSGETIGPAAPLFYAQRLLQDAAGPLVIFSLSGMAWLARRNWRPALVVAIFPALHAALISSQSARWDRYLVPLTPFVALGAGIGAAAIAGWLTQRWPGAQPREWLSLAGVVILFAAYPLVSTIKTSRLLASADVRTQAFEWYIANVPPHAKVAADPMGPPFSIQSHNLYLTWNPAEHSADWYVAQRFEYLVITEALLIDPNLTRQALSAYQELMNRFRLVKTFEGPMLGTAGLHIWVYEINP